MNRLSLIAADRRFRWCLVLSVLLSAVSFSYLGLMLQPRPLPVPAGIRMMRVAFLPTLPPPRSPIPVKRVAPKPVKRIPPRPVVVKRPMIVKPRRPVAPKVPRLRATLRRASPRHNPLIAKRPALPGGAASHAPALAATTVAPTPSPPTPAVRVPVMTAQNSRITIPLAPPATLDLPAVAPTPAPDNSGGRGTAAGSGEGNGSGGGRGDGQGPGHGTGGGPFGIGSGGPGNGEGLRHVVYILDISGSMTSRIDRAREELRGSLASLQRGETFDIITFSDEVHAFSNQMEPATPFLIQRADYFLTTLQVNGGTALESALIHALRMPGVNVVFVITDGVPNIDPNGEYVDQDRYMRILPGRVRGMNVNRARIYTIGLVGRDPDGRDESFAAGGMLQQIAQDSGGVSKIVPLGVAAP